MTANGTVPVVSPVADPPRSGTLEARASFVLKILAGTNAVGVVFAMLPESTPHATLHTLVFNVAAGLLTALYLVVAFALDRREPWAVAVVRPLLAVVAAGGLGVVAIALAGGRVRIPFELLLALWPWLGPADATPLPSFTRRSVGLFAAAVGMTGVILFGAPVFAWGGVLDVQEPDLRAALDVDCGALGSGPPESISVGYDWSWTRSALLPSGLDMVVVGWTGADGEDRPLYLLGEANAAGAGITSGLAGALSRSMADQAASESKGSWRWLVDLREHGVEPGHIELVLDLARAAPPDPEPVTIKATYIHVGLWRKDAASITCTW